MTLPTSNDLAELRKLRDDDKLVNEGGFARTPVCNPPQRAALTRVITLLESLENAEGHAKSLLLRASSERRMAEGSRNLKDTFAEECCNANAVMYEAGALALTERAAQEAKYARLLRDVDTILDEWQYADRLSDDAMDLLQEARAALKEPYNG